MYVKLFSSILTSSVWAEDIPTRIVWITLLALADKDGDVRASPSGLARVANVPLAACQHALERLSSPDPESGTQEHEGRRIEERDGGWFILNYVKYREIQDAEARKASWRESSRKHRQKRAASATSAERHQKSAEAEADTEAEVKATTQQQQHAESFVEPAHRTAYLQMRTRSRNPASFDAMLGTVVAPVAGGTSYPWLTVGQAMLEMESAGATPSAAAIRAYCRRLKDTPNGEPKNKLTEGRAALVRFVESSRGNA